MLKKLALGVPAIIAAMLPLVITGGGASAATSLTVRAGDGEKGYAVNLFLPDTIYINAGDTLKWNFAWEEPHTLSIGTPAGDPTQPTNPGATAPIEFDGSKFLSSGLVAKTTFDVTFTKTGSFKIFCAIHPGMTGTVNVNPPGIGQPDVQQSVDARADLAYKPALAQLKAVAAGLGAKPVAVTSKAGGGRKYTVVIAGETPSGDVQQYFPAKVQIQPNDSIEFKSDVHTPHTVTFGTPPPGDPFALPATKLGAGWDGTGLVHSGMLGIDWPGGLNYEVTFAKAGTYQYACLLHEILYPQGMAGTVQVGGAPGAPATGSGTARTATGRDGLWLIGGALALAIAAGGAAVYAVRRG